MNTHRLARQLLERGRATTDHALRAAVDTLPGSMRHIAGYHFGWWDSKGVALAGQPRASSGGKALRPTLVLLAAEAVSGDAEPAIPAAAAVELVHNFTLLHDDVMDGDATRRHRPTAWKVFGISSAILAGDALLTLAFDVLAASGHRRAIDGVRMLSAAVRQLLEGQADDLAFEERDWVDMTECLRMARRKTAALLECSSGLGGLFGHGATAQISCLRAFGVHIGLAFQLTDDLLGIWGDPGRTGKPVYSDLRSRKKSLPVVAALNSGTTAGARLASTYRSRDGLSDHDLAQLADWIDQAGGRRWCETQAASMLEIALERLDCDPALARMTELGALAKLIVGRDG